MLKKSNLWMSYNRDGTYTNPIIYSDYSDPDVIRVNDDFYLVSSSFNCVPGPQLLHSNDLINWTIKGKVFTSQQPCNVYDKPKHGCGVWAPSIRYHNDEFYIYYGDPDFGIYMTKTKDPFGEWDTPILIKEAKGWIDPCPFWDSNGSAYIVHAWANSRAGIKSILTLNKMNKEGTKIIDEGVMIFDGRKTQPTIEGPKIYKRNDYYYIFAPAGGVKTGWQTVLRSKNIYGPYEEKIVMYQGNTDINGPHQGAWVELKSGESWFVHFQDKGPYGRIVHLQPLVWIDDWPVIGIDKDKDGKGEPVVKYKKPDVAKNYPVCFPQTSDDFNNAELGLQWQWHANPKNNWFSLTENKGHLRLYSMQLPNNFRNFWSVPNLLLQKFPSEEFTITVKLDFNSNNEGDFAGLIIMGADYCRLSIKRGNNKFSISQAICKDAESGNLETESESLILSSNIMFLKVKVVKNAECSFNYSCNGKIFNTIGKVFNAKAGKWIGAKVGLFCVGINGNRKSFADFDWFKVK